MLVLLGIDPHRDYVNVLFVIQCYEVAVLFVGPPAVLVLGGYAGVALAAGSLVLELGVVQGLALGLLLGAVGIVLSTFVVGQELEERRAASERIVGDLRAARTGCGSIGRADELAALEQRAQVARHLEDSVMGTLTDVLEASAAARGRLGEPEAIAQLERLQEMTKQALVQMRRVITELRPTQG